MTEAAAESAPETTTTTSETPSTDAPPAADDYGAKYGDILKAMDGDKPAEGDSSTTDEQPKGDEKPEEKPTEEEKPTTEEPEKKPDDGKIELQLVKAQRELKRLTAESVKDKAAAKEAATALEKLKQAIRADFIQTAIDETGLPVEALFKRVQEGSTADPLANLPASVRATLEWAEKAQRAEAERAQREQVQAQRSADLDTLKAFLAEHEGEFTFLDPSDDTAGWLLDEVYGWMKENAGKQPDLKELAELAENHTLKTMQGLLTNERAVRKLVTIQPVRDLFTKVLGTPTQQQSPTSSKGTVVPKIPSASPEVTRASEPDDTADLVRGLEEFRRKQALGR